MNKPYVTPNPLDFKLRLVWSIDGTCKMVAEFFDSKWLPRTGETLVLPVEEKANSCRSWHKFKVIDVVYDFQNQVTRVLCSPVKSKPEPKDKWDAWEKAFTAANTTTSPEVLTHQSRLEYELSRINEKDVDEELEKLKSQIEQMTKRSLE